MTFLGLAIWCGVGSLMLAIICLVDTRKITVADLFHIIIFGIVWPLAVFEIYMWLSRNYGDKTLIRLKDKE